MKQAVLLLIFDRSSKLNKPPGDTTYRTKNTSVKGIPPLTTPFLADMITPAPIYFII
jgi:hypothetical protein